MAAAAVVERNVYEKASMSIAVSGETDAEADTFLKDKLCEQGLKVIEVYAEWGGRCEPLVPVLKRIQKEAEYAQNCAVVLHCKAESHDLLAEYRGKSMPHFLFYRNGTQVASVAGANMPEIEALLREHAPTSADADVLEENPMWIQRQEEKAAAEAAAQAALMGENE
ncbi:dynein 16 kDa light chain, flagellar outer arm [Micromonas commoda]|uniref:Dynein 16 kDa light chain, flagellar outer arm n=1 Tax=Micromonas commoda (strain RCC299 / NOUM17 / CCMP2709) TaxID=296587 RepID=C1E8L7_MICCC|nr:dynein 16 kDa light chain, flagellar outer arm [Micromonas commoda]ACO64533.1 dynein 16 kDa light chain, flagellar outer arm [Micromonas commoda]|eukprot:XP_002503275.1 dynein 16 kDa light chain, flagellar outer arm [Micromonas commoda]